MKKFISLLALVSVFAACQKEDISTAFKVDPGVIRIRCTAESFYAAEGNNKNITANTTFTSPGLTFTYNPDKLYAEAEMFSSETAGIDKYIDVTASWKGYDGYRDFSETKERVHVSVLPGGETLVELKFVLGKYTHGAFSYTPISFTDFNQSEYKYYFLDKAHDAGHQGTAYTHDGAEKVEIPGAYFVHNTSEFVLYGTAKYDKITGSERIGDLVWKVSDIDSKAKEQIEAEFESEFETFPVKKEPATYDFKVSAFAQYCVFHKVGKAITYVTYIRTDNLGNSEIVAEGSYYEYWENKVECYESAVPGHEGHYVAGHGHYDPAHSHGHGGDNAGGGIVYAD